MNIKMLLIHIKIIKIIITINIHNTNIINMPIRITTSIIITILVMKETLEILYNINNMTEGIMHEEKMIIDNLFILIN